MNDHQPTPTCIGVQDFADTAIKWLDASVSFSWLRAFEDISATIQPVAYLREQHYTYNMVAPVRGVSYRFRKSGFPTWADDIVSHKPRVIIYNLCEYNVAAAALTRLRRQLPETKHVLRLHHEARYLLCHTGFRECLLSADIAIAPTNDQIETLRFAGFQGLLRAIPFGVNPGIMGTYQLPFDQRPYDFVCANTSVSQKNTGLLHAVFEILNQKGYKTKNFGGVTAVQLAQQLGQSKVFFQPSMTEASGSRVLLEAIAAGCHPVAVAESPTTSHVAVEHGGHALVTGVTYDFKTKTIDNPDGAQNRIADQLVEILSQISASSVTRNATKLASEYDERTEREGLRSILLTSAGNIEQVDPLLGRAAEILLSIIGRNNGTPSGTTQVERASTAARDTGYSDLAAKVGYEICAELGCPEGAWGLSTKLFASSFNFAEEVQWLISRIKLPPLPSLGSTASVSGHLARRAEVTTHRGSAGRHFD
jgi:glycosyltransferase involved in cell wall biosynthesis